MFIIDVPEDLIDGFPVFIERRHLDLESLKVALRDKKLDEIYEIGHRMKGTGSVYGFNELTVIGGKLEVQARGKDLPSLKETVSQLEYALMNYSLKDQK